MIESPDILGILAVVIFFLSLTAVFVTTGASDE
jgi:hypothetical protein